MRRLFNLYQSFRFRWTMNLLLLLLGGCIKPNNKATLIEIPNCVLEEAVQEATIDPLFNSESIPNEWWTIFNDDQLTDFIQKAFDNNPTLKQAQANILLAAYNTDIVRASLLPNLLFGADVSRQKFSETGIIPFNSTGPQMGAAPTPATGGINGIPIYFTQYETELNLTYDFDIWGKNRNTLRAAVGEAYARMADEIFSRLQLGILVAQSYYQLQINYKRQEILQDIVDIQQKYFNLVQQRQFNNVETQLTLQSSQINVASANQLLLQVQGNIAVIEHQLKTYLANNFEEEISPVQITEQPLPKIPLPQNIPLHLISLRPDITSQLWLIESAGRQIQVAKAGFYPDFNLTAIFGYQTTHLQKLFNWPSSMFNVDPAISLPIFDGGRLLGNLRSSEVNYDLAIFEYNNLVLNAAREVLDGLAVLRNSDQQYKEFQKRSNYLEEQFKLTDLKVENNLGSALDLIRSQINMLQAKDQEVMAYGSTLQAILALIKALGGGYDISEGCKK